MERSDSTARFGYLVVLRETVRQFFLVIFLV